MKQITFVVTVEFEDSINDDDKNELEIAEKIAKGLIEQVNHEGLAPEKSETFTKAIKISRNGLYVVEENL